MHSDARIGGIALPQALNAARAHFSMWCVLKSPILLGNNLAKMNDATLNVLSDRGALAISQDPLGVQAKRVLSVAPPSCATADAECRGDNLVLLAACLDGSTNSADSTDAGTSDGGKGGNSRGGSGHARASRGVHISQRWSYRAVSTGQRMLRIAPCNASDPYQQFYTPSTPSTLINVGMNASVDSAVGGSEPWETRAPLGFAPTVPDKQSQVWLFTPDKSNPSLG